MERMLRFSLERDRVIRMMLLVDGTFSQVNARVIRYDDRTVDFITTRSPKPQTVRREDILSADFRRGDDGQ